MVPGDSPGHHSVSFSARLTSNIHWRVRQPQEQTQTAQSSVQLTNVENIEWKSICI